MTLRPPVAVKVVQQTKTIKIYTEVSAGTAKQLGRLVGAISAMVKTVDPEAYVYFDSDEDYVINAAIRMSTKPVVAEDTTFKALEKISAANVRAISVL